MTGDAQAEAERIVDALAEDAGYLASMLAEERHGELPDNDELLAEVAERNRVGNERRDRLVAALAAAREVYDSRRMLGTEWGEYKVEVDRFAWERLAEALSALRARAGEGEWPSHLKDDAPYLVCDRCGRKEWAIDRAGSKDAMTQPDGHPCGGTFARAGEET